MLRKSHLTGEVRLIEQVSLQHGEREVIIMHIPKMLHF